MLISLDGVCAHSKSLAKTFPTFPLCLCFRAPCFCTPPNAPRERRICRRALRANPVLLFPNNFFIFIFLPMQFPSQPSHYVHLASCILIDAFIYYLNERVVKASCLSTLIKESKRLPWRGGAPSPPSRLLAYNSPHGEAEKKGLRRWKAGSPRGRQGLYFV